MLINSFGTILDQSSLENQSSPESGAPKCQEGSDNGSLGAVASSRFLIGGMFADSDF